MSLLNWDGDATYLDWASTFRPKLKQVEIRRYGMVIVVSLEGFSYNGIRTGRHSRRSVSENTKTMCLSMAGGKTSLTFQDWGELFLVVEEAKKYLKNL